MSLSEREPPQTVADEAAAGDQSAIARPLPQLIPLIRADLQAARTAGLPYYIAAGEKLLEAKSQLQHGEFTGWVKLQFEQVSVRQCRDYMRLAEVAAQQNGSALPFSSIRAATRPARPVEPLRPPITNRIPPGFAARMAESRAAEKKELTLVLDLGEQVIEAGYRVLASKLHPDKGGNDDAMSRLTRVRNRLRKLNVEIDM